MRVRYYSLTHQQTTLGERMKTLLKKTLNPHQMYTEDEYQVRMKKEEEKKTPLPSLTDQMRKKKEENPQIMPRKPAQRRNR